MKYSIITLDILIMRTEKYLGETYMSIIISFKQFLESYQYNGRNLPTPEEIEGAKKSNLQSKNHGDIRAHIQIHPGYRAWERRGDMKPEHWDHLVSKSIDHLKDKKAGHYLTYSHKHKQGIVSEWMPHKKRLEVITVLPKGKSFPKEGTERHIVESLWV